MDTSSTSTALAYSVLCFVSIVLLILFSITCHLIKFVCTERSRAREEHQQVISFAITTFLGLLAFEISLLFIITVTIELLCADSNHDSVVASSMHDVVYHIHSELEYLIPLFDALGHIFILIVLIKRFQISFTNTIFGDFSKIIRFMKLFVAFSTIMTITIVIAIIFVDNSPVIMSLEIIWEISIEIMCLWLLYLFVTKLFVLLSWSLKCVNPLMSDLSLFRDFQDSMGPKLEKRRSVRSVTKSGESPGISRRNSRSRTRSRSTHRMQHSQHSTATTATHSTNISITGMTPTVSNSGSTPSTHSSHSNHSNVAIKTLEPPPPPPVDAQTQQNMELLNVMIKLTVLIMVCVFTSVLSVFGNITLEMRWIDPEFNDLDGSTMDIRTVTLYLLPTVDILITSLMVYLQFNFAETVYLKMCGKMDLCCLRCGLWFVRKVVIPSSVENEFADNVENRDNATTINTIDLSRDLTITVNGHHVMESDTNSNTSHNGAIQRHTSQSTVGSSCSMADFEIVFQDNGSNQLSPPIARQSSVHGNGVGNNVQKLPQIKEAPSERSEPSVDWKRIDCGGLPGTESVNESIPSTNGVGTGVSTGVSASAAGDGDV